MNQYRRLGIAIGVALAVCACGAPGPTGQAPSTPSSMATPSTTELPTPPAPSSPDTPPPSAPPTPSAEPTAAVPALSCGATPVAGSLPLLMVHARDSQSIEIDSFANPTHPVVLCVLTGAAGHVKLISPTEIGLTYNASTNNPIGGTTSIERMGLIDRRAVIVTSFQGDALDVAWSPDGSSVAYLAYTYAPNLGSGDANRLWIKVGAADPQALTPLIPLFGRDGSVDDENIVRFSSDGHYLLMVDTFVSGAAPSSPDQAVLQVHSVPDGALVWVPPSALDVSGNKFGPYVTMAAWSHQSNRLYYRDNAGVHSWEPGGAPAMFALGAPWRWPSLSPDDSLLAYELPALGSSYVEVRNLVTGSKQGWPARMPRLLSDNELITGHVDGGWFVRNLTTGVETALSDISAPIDAWPH